MNNEHTIPLILLAYNQYFFLIYLSRFFLNLKIHWMKIKLVRRWFLFYSMSPRPGMFDSLVDKCRRANCRFGLPLCKYTNPLVVDMHSKNIKIMEHFIMLGGIWRYDGWIFGFSKPYLCSRPCRLPVAVVDSASVYQKVGSPTQFFTLYFFCVGRKKIWIAKRAQTFKTKDDSFVRSRAIPDRGFNISSFSNQYLITIITKKLSQQMI